MKRLLPLLLAFVLLLGGLNSQMVSAQDDLLSALTKEDLNLSFLKHPMQYEANENELSGLLTLKELEAALDPKTKVRVVIELQSDPVIVEATKRGISVDEMSDAEVAAIQDNLLNEQASVKQELSNKHIETSVNDGDAALDADDSYTVAVNAFTTYVAVEDISEVEKLSLVKNVYVSNEYSRPEVVVNQNNASEMVGAQIAWDQYALKGEGTVVAVIDSGIDPSHKDFVLSDPSLAALSRDDVDALGLPGKYYSEKVPYAYNYYDLSQKVVDIATDGQHGQHVAGSVAANGTVKGVAPEAQILGMKVFSDDFDYATTFSDIYLKAIDDAIALGADVLNMSLGSPAGFYVEGSIEDVALKNAQENGIVSTISAGNEYNAMYNAATWASYLGTGYAYPQYKNPDLGVVGTPSLNEASLSVASIENFYQTVGSATIHIAAGPENVAIMKASGSPNPWEALPSATEIVPVGIGAAADFNAVGSAVQGKVALVARGNAFADSLANAQTAGAVGLIVYNRAGDESLVSMAGGDGARIPFVFMGYTGGNKLAVDFAAGNHPKVSFNASTMLIENASGGLMSAFSSWGSTPDLRMKPEITAPGGMIYSTQNNDTYGTMSGTSMAAPNAAGGAAVVTQHIKTNEMFEALNLTPLQRAELAKTLLMNTAIPIYDDYGDLYFVRQQGAGLMNVANALETPVYVVETNSKLPKVELGEVGRTINTSLTLTNLSDQEVTYVVSTDLLTDFVYPVSGYYLNLMYADYVPHSLNSATEVTVPAHGSVDLPVSISFGDEIPYLFMEGFIYLDSIDGSVVDLSVPFLGFYGDWDALSVVDELRWNLFDNTKANDPTFVLTTLVNPTDDTFYFVNSNEKIWINPGNPLDAELYGTDHIGLLATMMRNVEEANFRVLDSSGEVVRELGRHNNVRKIVRLGTSAPYSFFSNGVWDGHINNQPVEDGDVYTYQIEFLRTKNSTPQTMEFEINVDNTLPTIENLVYNPATYQLTFDAKDNGSGLAEFAVLNYFNPAKQMLAGTGVGQYAELLAVDGKITYSVNIKSVLEASGSSFIVLLAMDKVGNTEIEIFIADPLLNKDIIAGAPQVNEVVAGDTSVKGSSRANDLVKVYQGSTLLGSATAASDGSFEVAIDPKDEGTVLSVSATNPQNGTESPKTNVTVVKKDIVVTGNVYLDGVLVNDGLDEVNFELVKSTGQKIAGSLVSDNPLVLQFNDVTTGRYKLSASNLPAGFYLGNNVLMDVSSTNNSDKHLYLTATAPAESQEPEKVEGPYGQGQISIDLPDLLEAYNDADVRMKGKAWGYKLMTEMVANGNINLPLTKLEKTSVYNASDAEVFFGNVYTFDATVTLDDDYYEMPFMIRSSDDVTAQTVRRFWVDTTAPLINATVLDRDSNSSTALIELETYDNMSILEIYRDDSFVNVHDWTNKGFNTRDIQAVDTDLVKLVDGLNTFTYSVYDIAGNVSQLDVLVMKADKSILNALLQFIQLMDNRSEALEAAYQAGLLVSKDPMATQEEIDEAVAALYAAQESLKDLPLIIGAADITVYVGDAIDLLAGVSAIDANGNDLTARIVVSPATVDTSVAGVTEVTYSVIDDDGKEASVTIVVTVLDEPVVEVNKAALRMAITIGEDTLNSSLLPAAYRARLLAAVEAGQVVLDDPNATQDEVDAAAEAIRVALDFNSPVNQGPTLAGVKNVDVELNGSVDVLAGVSASDAQDGDLTSQITASPATIDTTVLGETVVIYTVMDSDGNEASASAVFSVKAADEMVKADTSALEALLAEALKADVDKVDDKLVKELQDAMKHASDVLDATDPSQELVDNAWARLDAALKAVKDYKVPDINDPSKPKDPKPSEEDDDKQETILSANGVTISGLLEKGVSVSVEKLDKKFSGYTGQVYEIKLMKNGVVIQPKQPVKVTISTLGNDQAKVFHILNNQPQEHPSSVNGDVVEFMTDSFSIWLVGNKVTSEDKPSTDVDKPRLPGSGQETTTLYTVAGIAVISYGLWFVVGKKKKED